MNATSTGPSQTRTIKPILRKQHLVRIHVVPSLRAGIGSDTERCRRPQDAPSPSESLTHRNDRQQHQACRFGHSGRPSTLLCLTTELSLPHKEVFAVDVSIVIGVTVFTVRIRYDAKAKLPREEIISIDVAILVEIGCEKEFTTDRIAEIQSVRILDVQIVNE